MTLETDRLILRNIVDSDAEDIFDYSHNEDVGPNAGWKPHENIEETKQIINDVFKDEISVFGIILKDTKKLIGTIGLIADPKRENPRARMLGYALSKDYWGLGIMTEAAKSVINYGFKSPCTDIITCCCYSYNKRSRRVIEKCGFVHEGTLHDGEMRYDGEIFDLECFVLSK